MGANRSIPAVGIFPPKEEDPQAWVEARSETQAWEAARNYSSFSDNQADSEEEMQRLMELGYVKKITKAQAVNYFTEPIVSKLGLIVKPKADGTVKRRIIVDALRSGANKKARCPERILLPRALDVFTMASDLKSLEPQLLEWYRAHKVPTIEWASELIAADLTDAFTHFAVHPSEHEQCLSRAGDGERYYVFVAMFFGHKCAPLVMCRLSALLSRLLQGMFWQAELQLATYIDDPLTVLVGSRRRRNRNLSLALRRSCARSSSRSSRSGRPPVAGAPKLRGKAQLGGRHLQEGQVGGLHDLWKHAARPARTNRPKEFMVPIKRFEMARAWLANLAQGEAPENHHDVVEEARVHHNRHGCLPPQMRVPLLGEGDGTSHLDHP